MLKTCGTTRLLSAVDPILELAALNEHEIVSILGKIYALHVFISGRAARAPRFILMDECEFLESRFGHLGSNSSCVMGSNFDDAQWHVYVAGDFVEEEKIGASLSVECCMTSLNREHSQHFFRVEFTRKGVLAIPFVSSSKTTHDSGIRSIFETFSIDDYVFEPWVFHEWFESRRIFRRIFYGSHHSGRRIQLCLRRTFQHRFESEQCLLGVKICRKVRECVPTG